MDPISQGVLGASMAQAATPASRTRKLITITWAGWLAGMAPDLDVLINSSTDPILFLEYHRQFTHALIFIPIGALLCALVFHRFARHALTFGQLYLVCLLGYATHGLLDACTTYGTQLLWPFSNERFAWNNVSIIDPLFTLPLLVLMVLGIRRQSPRYGQIAMVWALTYLAFGVVQRERAEAFGLQMAESRGHAPLRLSAKPGFANMFLWKVVYETEDRFWVDAVRVGLTPRWFEGDSLLKLNVARDLPWLTPDSQQATDLVRFGWFSMDYLAIDRYDKHYIIDVRYSMLPNEIRPLWGVRLDPQKPDTAHIDYVTSRDTSPDNVRKLFNMFFE
ncbi:MAG: metal-dependent hydrolase [Pseudomonadales bacterium]|nr:metal-dependent hydrolase [Pseudomonadales bacterium]